MRGAGERDGTESREVPSMPTHSLAESFFDQDESSISNGSAASVGYEPNGAGANQASDAELLLREAQPQYDSDGDESVNHEPTLSGSQDVPASDAPPALERAADTVEVTGTMSKTFRISQLEAENAQQRVALCNAEATVSYTLLRIVETHSLG
eukprot:scaffold893_cov336-Prasinococcus_capsulatus_cf.AAC.3